jgi:PAS domain S-box-containing protein
MNTSEVLKSILDTLMDGVIMMESDGTVFAFNPAAARIFGYPAEQIIGCNVNELVPAPHKGQHDIYLEKYLHGGESNLVGKGVRELMAQHRDGHTLPVELAISEALINGRRMFIGIVRDISKRKQADEAMRLERERFELAMRGSTDGLWDWNLLTNEVYYSPRWKEMLGYKDEELANSVKSWSEHIHDEDLPRALRTVDAYVGGEIDEYHIEYRMYHKQGMDVDILSRAILLCDEAGKPLRLIGTHVDITQQKQMEALLRESEKRFRTIFDSAQDAMMLLDDNGFVDCNPATLKMFGCVDRKDFTRLHPADLSPPRQPDGADSLNQANEQIAIALQEGKHFFEWRHRRNNGEEFSAEVLLSAMKLSGRRVLHATVRDISARKAAEKKLKEAQAQLLQSEKLASIGQLAAGVAHEINNPVGYVNSNLGSLKRYIKDLLALAQQYEALESQLPDNKAKRALISSKERLDIEFLKQDLDDLIQESLEGIDRVKQIVRDLKDFSHVDEATWEIADVHHGINSTLNIVHNELKYKAEVIKEYGELPTIYCLPSQLNQVFMNLLVNAGHALQDKGKIFIRTGVQGGDHVWIEIEDTGAGIPPQNLKRIFEPFFTTKEVGKGTGLGLSLAYGIIEKHQGTIEVDSEQGRGTRFRILLPVGRGDT